MCLVGVLLPNVEDILMFHGDRSLMRASLTGLSKSFEHEWRGYFCALNIDAFCASKQCELLASAVTVKWPGISA